MIADIGLNTYNRYVGRNDVVCIKACLTPDWLSENENKLRQYAAFIEMTKNFIFVNHIYAIYLKIDPQVIEKGGASCIIQI